MQLKMAILIIGLLCLKTTAHSQSTKESDRQQLNHDIWIPFMKGVNTNDPALYNGVNSKDFHWVMDGEKPRIMNHDEHVKDAANVMNSRAAKGIVTEIEIRFAVRNIHHSFASEKIILRYTPIEEGKEPVHYYSAGLVFSRKENDIWKRLIQYHIGPATPEEFDKAEKIE